MQRWAKTNFGLDTSLHTETQCLLIYFKNQSNQRCIAHDRGWGTELVGAENAVRYCSCRLSLEDIYGAI